MCSDTTELQPKNLTKKPRKRKLISKAEGDKNTINQVELLGRFDSLMSLETSLVIAT